MSDRPTDEQIQAIIDWPVPLGRMTAPLLAREVLASRKLIADLRADHQPVLFAPTISHSAVGCTCGWGIHDGDQYPCPTIRAIDEAGL